MSTFPEFLDLFSLTLSPAEIIVRGTAVYWFLFLLFRFVMRRDVGAIAIADVLLLVMIADASQSAMAGDAKSIADGCLLVATIAGWNYLLDWSSYHVPLLRRFVEAKPLLLIRDGRMVRANMRREFITADELESKIREQGIPRLDAVHEAYLESDGEISVLLKEGFENVVTTVATSHDKNGSGTGLPAILKAGPSDIEDESSVKRPRHAARSSSATVK